LILKWPFLTDGKCGFSKLRRVWTKYRQPAEKRENSHGVYGIKKPLKWAAFALMAMVSQGR
jgi:hypothetical protein